MFCHTILDQMKFLVMNKEIPHTDINLKEKELIFEKIIQGDLKSFFKEAIKINLLDAKKGTYDHHLA